MNQVCLLCVDAVLLQNQFLIIMLILLIRMISIVVPHLIKRVHKLAILELIVFFC